MMSVVGLLCGNKVLIDVDIDCVMVGNLCCCVIY